MDTSKQNPSKIKGIKKKKNIPSGATCFFRNRKLFDVIREEIQTTQNSKVSVLFHSCSAGAEVYSFLISCLEDHSLKKQIVIHATDINSDYLQFAKRGIYSEEDVKHLSKSEKSYFEKKGTNEFHIKKSLRTQVEFLPPADFRTYTTQTKYDFVCALNSLCYVTREEQTMALKNISKYNAQYLILSGAHVKFLKRDLLRLCYKPVRTKGFEIFTQWHLRHLKGADISTKINEMLFRKTKRKQHLARMLFLLQDTYKTHCIFKKTNH